MREEPSIEYGRLVEAVYSAGHHFERAWQRLEWLLVGNRWQQVGPGYTDINTFLGTIKLPEGVTPDRRKKVAARIKALQPEASQRKIAGALGVDEKTVRNDFSPAADSSAAPAPSTRNDAVPVGARAEHSAPPGAHVRHNSGEQEWYTPPAYLEAARQVLGAIDLDPASTPQANQVVQASRYYTKEQEGLSYHWTGRVWMNPPYAADLVGKFTHKLFQHLIAGDVPEALVLVNNATETNWFQELADVCPAVCFPQGRVRFLDPQGNPGAPLQGQAVLYSGPQVDRFLTLFRPFGGLWRRDATNPR